MHHLHKHRHFFHIIPTLIIAAIFIFNYTHTFAAYYYASQFGTEGVGNGQFSYPRHIAQDASGNLYVTDNGNSRVQKFDSNGNYISQFGVYGTGDGEMYDPDGIQIVGSNLYLVEGINNRVQIFDLSGNYVSKFGTPGTGDGEFDHPSDIAIDTSGNMYVTDKLNNRVQKFNSSGVFVSTFGTSGSATGEFIFPESIDFHEDYLYVSDTSNNRIQKFDLSGNFVSTFGEYGETPGTFLSPIGMAFDSSDNMYIVDSGNNRVQKFDSSGNFLEVFSGPGISNGSLSSPVDIVLNSSGELLVTDQNMHRVQRFSTSAQAPLEPRDVTATALNAGATVSFTEPTNDGGSPILYYTVTSNPGNVSTTTPGTSTAIYGLTNGVSYHFVVTATNAIGTSATTTTLSPIIPRDPTLFGYEYSSQIGTKGSSEVSNDGELYQPRRVITDPLGNIYIVDTYNNRVQKFDTNGNFILKFGTNGNLDGELFTPVGISLDSAGNIFIADSNNSRIQKFNSSGVYISQFGINGSANGELTSPNAVFVDKLSNDDIYVADTQNHRVQKFSSSTSYISQFGTLGSGDGQMNQPKDIIRNGSYLYVLEDSNNRVQKFDLNGDFVSKFGSFGSSEGQFYQPEQIAFNSTGDIFVSDVNRVQRFDSNGAYVSELQGAGTGPGQFQDIAGIYIDPNNDNLFVVDKGNGRIQKFVPIVSSPDTVPTAPQNVTAVAGNSNALLSFEIPSSDGGSAILYYRITSTPGNIIATTTGTTTSVTGLINDTEYTFVVNAINSIGTSATSSPSNAVTPTAPISSPPSTNLCPKGRLTSESCLCSDGRPPTPVDSGTRVQEYTCERGGFLPVFIPPSGDASLPVEIQEILTYESWPPQNQDVLQQVLADPRLQNILIQHSLFIKNYRFKKNLSVGMTNNDVKALQMFLNTRGFILARVGYGSIGNETSYFGNATRQALIKFQKANSIYPASGYFGPVTREFVNKILEVKN